MSEEWLSLTEIRELQRDEANEELKYFGIKTITIYVDWIINS
jgi:hypothetical protein